MLNKILAFLSRLLRWVKYRNIRLKNQGIKCNYQALDSVFLSPESIVLGHYVHIGRKAVLEGAGGIQIGDGAILAPEVKIYTRTHNFHHDLQALPFDDVVLTAPVEIGRYVWIGTQVIILPGVHIGDGAVIGAGSVVTKDVLPCTIVAGNPARPVGMRNQQRFEELMKSEEPFVYQKFGHGKRAIPKDLIAERKK